MGGASVDWRARVVATGLAYAALRPGASPALREFERHTPTLDAVSEAVRAARR